MKRSKHFKLMPALLALAALAAVIALSGCGDKRNKEYKARFPEIKAGAESYLEGKYGGDFTVSDGKFFYSQGLFYSYNTGTAQINFTDGTIVYYIDDDKGNGESVYYDQRQSDEVMSDFVNKKLPEMMKSALGEDYEGLEYHIDEEKISICQRIDSLSDCFFHEYYSGDIEEFLKKEDASLDITVCLICEPEDWQSPLESVKNEFCRLFDDNGRRYFFAMNKDAYEKDLSNISEDGVYAEIEVWLGKTKVYIQKYIEVLEGIYVCAYNEDGFVLEEGDIVFTPREDADGITKYSIKFSDRAKEAMTDDEYFRCYIKLDKEIYGEYIADSTGETHMTFNMYNPKSDKNVMLCQRRPVSAWLRVDGIYWYGECVK